MLVPPSNRRASALPRVCRGGRYGALALDDTLHLSLLHPGPLAPYADDAALLALGACAAPAVLSRTNLTRLHAALERATAANASSSADGGSDAAGSGATAMSNSTAAIAAAFWRAAGGLLLGLARNSSADEEAFYALLERDDSGAALAPLSRGLLSAVSANDVASARSGVAGAYDLLGEPLCESLLAAATSPPPTRGSSYHASVGGSDGGAAATILINGEPVASRAHHAALELLAQAVVASTARFFPLSPEAFGLSEPEVPTWATSLLSRPASAIEVRYPQAPQTRMTFAEPHRLPRLRPLSPSHVCSLRPRVHSSSWRRCC